MQVEQNGHPLVGRPVFEGASATPSGRRSLELVRGTFKRDKTRETGNHLFTDVTKKLDDKDPHADSGFEQTANFR